MTSSHSWGKFEIQIRINFVAESGEKAITLHHHLKLHPWTVTFPASGTAFPADLEIPSPENAAKLGPVHSRQYDEIVFTDLFQPFLALLTVHPPTPLPKSTKKPIPFHTSNPASVPETRRMGVPEFTSEMQKEETERSEEARGKTLKEQKTWRDILADREKEPERLQKMLARAGRPEGLPHTRARRRERKQGKVGARGGQGKAGQEKRGRSGETRWQGSVREMPVGVG